MKWNRPLPHPGNIAAILLLIAIVALLTFVSLKPSATSDHGFGKEWECTPLPKGEPVCIKKPSP